jgi:hypothetical protein
MSTIKFDEHPVTFIKIDNIYYVIANDLCKIFADGNPSRACKDIVNPNKLKKRLKLPTGIAECIILTKEGVEQFCKIKLRYHADVATRLSACLANCFTNLYAPTVVTRYICNEPWIIKSCKKQLRTEEGLIHPDPKPDLKHCVCPNEANIIEYPEACNQTIVEQLTKKWFSETYPFMRLDERELRMKYIWDAKFLPKTIAGYLQHINVRGEVIKADDPIIDRARKYLVDNIEPDTVTWPLPDSYKLLKWELSDGDNHDRKLKFVYSTGPKMITEVTVCRI